MEKSPERLRDMDYEHQVERNMRLKEFRRSVKDIMKRLPFGVGNILIRTAHFTYRPILLGLTGKRLNISSTCFIDDAESNDVVEDEMLFLTPKGKLLLVFATPRFVVYETLG